jgi:hypothetical protein
MAGTATSSIEAAASDAQARSAGEASTSGTEPTITFRQVIVTKFT